jgi:hypothetical protein
MVFRSNSPARLLPERDSRPSPFRSATEPALPVRRKELIDRYRRKPRSRDKTRSAPLEAVNFSFPDWRDAYIQ